MSTAPHGTIQRTASARPDLLSFDILGHIPTEDMDWMAREVDGAFERHDEIDMLLVMRRFDGVDAGTMVDPAVLKVQFRSLGKVRRYGVVGAPAWANIMINAFDVVISVDAKTFALTDEVEARRWVEGAPEVA